MEKFFNLQRFAVKKIKLTEKDDIYANDFSNRVFYALGGKDSIYNAGSYVTVDGGAGSDYIYGGYNASLSSYNASLSSYNGGAGSDVIENHGYSAKINGGAGNDSVVNSNGSYATINGGAGNDNIENHGYSAKINGGAGNDSVVNSNGSYATINGGAGNDTIHSTRGYALISGDKGDDTVIMSGYNNRLEYANGDGKDVVFGFDSNDTLNITKGSYKAKAKGDDVIITVGKGSITLKGMAGEELSIKNSKGKIVKKTYGKVSASKSVSKLWFDEENNFVQDNLDSIIEDKAPSALENLETSNISNLAAKTSLASGIENG